MTKITIIILTVVCSLPLVGCGNLSPRINPELKQQIDNQNGRIDEIESNQNSIKNELESVQDGLLNVNNQSSNSGIQIFSGSGGLFLGLVGVLAIFVIMMHYQQKAKTAEKAADILAENIVHKNDEDLNENVFKAAMYTDAEEKIYNLVSKHRKMREKINQHE
jgi:TolA-binding protein